MRLSEADTFTTKGKCLVRGVAWEEHAGGGTLCIISATEIIYFCLQSIHTGVGPYHQMLLNLLTFQVSIFVGIFHVYEWLWSGIWNQCLISNSLGRNIWIMIESRSICYKDCLASLFFFFTAKLSLLVTVILRLQKHCCQGQVTKPSGLRVMFFKDMKEVYVLDWKSGRLQCHWLWFVKTNVRQRHSFLSLPSDDLRQGGLCFCPMSICWLVVVCSSEGLTKLLERMWHGPRKTPLVV